MNDYFSHNSCTIDEGATIGTGSKIWHYTHVMSSAKIGDNCILGQNVFIGSKVKIGDRVKIQNNVSLYEGVVCEDDVFIGPSVVFTNVINPRSFVDRKNEFKSTVVEKGASLGANTTIICGNKIGKFAMIGAGAVVTKDIEAYALVIGNPAKLVGWVSESGQRLEFGINNEAICAATGEHYTLTEGVVKKN
jgi:UDP-2-acetamido-3-amino-2,3-dideoxy-glucuronate N-acetyltransferase